MHAYAENTPASFGGRLARARECAGISQPRLARAAGISLASVSAYESGRRLECDISTLIALAQALGTSPATLMPAGPYASELKEIAITGQFPPREPETGSARVPVEVLGMNNSPGVYALHVVDESLAREGIHADDYMIVEPDDTTVATGVYLLNEQVVIRTLDTGSYCLVVYPDGATQECNGDRPKVAGRVLCCGNWRSL